MEQLVLPQVCRVTAMKFAYTTLQWQAEDKDSEANHTKVLLAYTPSCFCCGCSECQKAPSW